MSIQARRTPPTLEPASCGLCGGVEAEPVAVGQDFRDPSAPDTYLTVRCSACGLLYLTPAPDAEPAPADMPPPVTGPLAPAARRGLLRLIERWGRRLQSGSRLLIPQAARPVAERARLPGVELLELEPAEHPPTTPADGALLLGWLETRPAPLAALQALRPRLRDDARVLVIATNPGSAAARLFRGRHWAGYDFPRSRALANGATLGALADRAGFVVEACLTLPDPTAWTVSAGYLLRDWGAPPWLGRALGPTSRPAGAIAALLERLGTERARAGLVAAALRLGPGRVA